MLTQAFIEIPNLTPAFDPEFLSNGLIDNAVDFVVDFAEKQVSGFGHAVLGIYGTLFLCLVHRNKPLPYESN